MFEEIKALRQHNALGMEAIDFQPKKEFGMAIEEELERLLGSGRVTKKAIAESNLAKIIEDFTGMPVKMVGETGYDAYMNFENVMNKNHPLIEGFIREFLTDSSTLVDYGKMKHQLITVDLRRGYIHNLRDDVKHIIGLGTGFFEKRSNINMKEVTAIMLHEIGHWFSYYEFLSRQLSTNAVMLDVTQRIMRIDDPQKRILAVSELRKEGIDNKALDELDNVASEKEAMVLILSEEVKQARSELGIDIYDITQWEKLADQYCARWGYGRYVVTGLDKLYAETGTGTRAGAIVNLVTSTIFALSLVSGAFANTAVAITSLITGSFGVAAVAALYAILAIGLLGLLGDPGWIYDDNKVRFDNVKKQLIARLKETDDKKEVRVLLNDIQAIEDIANRTFNDDDFNMFKLIGRRLGVINNRRNWRALESQRIMEYFANSELNIAAARLENE